MSKSIKVSESPALLKIWDYEKNNNLDINKLTVHSHEDVNWYCKKCGHKWSDSIKRTYESNGKCICCERNKVIIQGINDIFTRVPGLKHYYDFDKNAAIDILTLTVSCSTPLWWKCPACGHSWQGKITGRFRKVTGKYEVIGCQKCYHQRRISTVASHKVLSEFWDHEKNHGKNIETLSVHSTESVDWKCKKCNYEWSDSPKNRLAQKCRCPHCESKRKVVKPGVNDVLTLCPDILKYIEPNKNKGLDLSQMSVYAKDKLYFKCPDCGEEWQASLKSRIAKKDDGTFRVKKHSCNRAGLRTISYAEEYPYLDVLYDKRNNNKALTEIIKAKETFEEYNWICDKCGFSFPSTLNSMIASIKKNNNGCPYCSHTKVRPGESFADIHPELMEEYDESNTINPYDSFPNSKAEVIWNCKTCNHKWPASFYLRHIGNGKCPICNPTIAIPATNTVEAIYHEIASMWSVENNKSADEIIYSSTQWVHLNCPACGQIFGTYLNEYISGKSDCPYCAGRKPIPGKTSFKAKHPDLMNEWDFVNNYCILDPDNIFDSNTTSVWWICSNNESHRYTMSVKRRLEYEKRNREPCPYCKGRRRKKKRFL